MASLLFQKVSSCASPVLIAVAQGPKDVVMRHAALDRIETNGRTPRVATNSANARNEQKERRKRRQSCEAKLLFGTFVFFCFLKKEYFCSIRRTGRPFARRGEHEQGE